MSKLKGLFIGANILGAYLLGRIQLESQGTVEIPIIPDEILPGSSSVILNAINHACNASNAIRTINKANGIELGMRDVGKSKPLYAPLSCWENNEFKCDDSVSDNIFQNDRIFGSLLNETRKIYNNFGPNWQEEVENLERHVNGLKMEITNIQFLKINQEFMRLQLLSIARNTHQYAKEIGTGKCGEHTEVALDKIRVIAEANPNVYLPRIQKVTVRDVTDNHSFLLIGNSQPDIRIKQNPLKVNQYLDEMGGKICDTWNSLPGLISKDRNNMYQRNAGWHSLSTWDVTPGFNSIGIPPKIASYLQSLFEKYLYSPMNLAVKIIHNEHNTEILPKLKYKK